MAQNPWDDIPVIQTQPAQAATGGEPQRQVVFTDTSSHYTNETPEELIAQGYTQKPDGNWERVERVQLSDEELRSAGYAPNQQTGRYEPWSDIEPVSESQLRANAAADTWVNNPMRKLQGADLALSQGVHLGGQDELYGLINTGLQAARNTYSRATGQPVEFGAREYGRATQQAINANEQRFREEHPVASFGLNVFGGMGLGAAGGARSAAPSLLSTSAAGAGTGAVAGGLSANGGLSDRALGAGTGAVIGGVLPSGIAAASVPARQAASAGQRIVSMFGNRQGRVVRPGPNVTPEQSAATRLAQFVTDDARASEARRLGLGVETAPIDVLGGTAERRVRAAAAPAGPAAEYMVDQSVRRAANLKPQVMDDVRAWSPAQETADQASERLTTMRGDLAERDYADAYRQQVNMTPEVLSALSGREGRAAMDRAYRAASARRNTEQMAEINALREAINDGLPRDVQMAGGGRITVGRQPRTVSGGTLDRIQIAMRDQADTLSRNGARDIAGGISGRRSQVNEALDGFEGLADARQNYRELSQAIDAVENPQGFMTAEPSTFLANFDELPDVARQAAIIGERQSALNTIGTQRDAGVGYLQNMTQGDYPQQNLATMLGEDAAGRFTDRVNLRIGDAQRAARMSPNTNSQTFGRALDDQQFNAAEAVGSVTDVLGSLTGNVPAAARVFDRIRGRMAMGPEDREAVVRLAMDSGRTLDDIVAMAEQARAAGLPPPREVRGFIETVRGSFGRNSPAAIDIEKLLLPAPAAAEEQPEQPLP